MTKRYTDAAKDKKRIIEVKHEIAVNYRSLDDVIKLLQTAKQSLTKDGCEDITCYINVCEQYGDYTVSFLLYARRPEFFIEKQEREREEARYKQARKDTYEALKKEFGDE